MENTTWRNAESRKNYDPRKFFTLFTDLSPLNPNAHPWKKGFISIQVGETYDPDNLLSGNKAYLGYHTTQPQKNTTLILGIILGSVIIISITIFLFIKLRK